MTLRPALPVRAYTVRAFTVLALVLAAACSRNEPAPAGDAATPAAATPPPPVTTPRKGATSP